MDHENERQQALTEARETLHLDEGETLEARFGPESFGGHELLDRAHLMLANWETFICAHPAALLDAERYRRAREIAAAMAEFYRLVGDAPRGGKRTNA